MYSLLFPLGLFLSAGLLFIIQPMVAKVLLPLYGGTPAVWTVCMLFFQLLLLIAYGYAWIVSQFKNRLLWRLVHLSLCGLSLLALPLSFSPVLQGSPELSIFKNLILQLGLPLLIVGTSAPLLQYVFSQTTRPKASDPYFLYVASNVGSLLALLSYPWLVERYTGIQQQFYDWTLVYIVYLLVLFFLLCFFPVDASVKPLIKKQHITWSRGFEWVFLSFVPCSLMLGVTAYITTDVAATPLFWVLPLSLYLLSFVITFNRKPVVSHQWIVRHCLLFLLLPISSFIIGIQHITAVNFILANLLGYFMLTLLCHGELMRVRPNASQLTLFYFCMALGGVLAGLFNGIMAPRIFSHAYEYPLGVLLALLCIPLKRKSSTIMSWSLLAIILILLFLNEIVPDGSTITWLKEYHVAELVVLILILFRASNRFVLFIGIAMLLSFVFIVGNPLEMMSQQRNFYGIKQVFSKNGAHVLMSQSTLHGFQVQSDLKPSDGARGYYGPVWPIVEALQTGHSTLHALILGLGTGMMVCQFREHDRVTLVEIDEQVIDIANNPTLFTYLRDCPTSATIIKEDGRIAVEKMKNNSYELLIMDAFNSDAIPVHLLTLESFLLYKEKLTQNGAILVNMSNRHLNILPVLAGAARELDMIILYTSQSSNHALAQFPSEWALLTTDERLAGQLMDEGWHFVTDNTQLWTDDYSNLIPLLKW